MKRRKCLSARSAASIGSDLRHDFSDERLFFSVLNGST
jgi:hypothetical protein